MRMALEKYNIYAKFCNERNPCSLWLWQRFFSVEHMCSGIQWQKCHLTRIRLELRGWLILIWQHPLAAWRLEKLLAVWHLGKDAKNIILKMYLCSGCNYCGRSCWWKDYMNTCEALHFRMSPKRFTVATILHCSLLLSRPTVHWLDETEWMTVTQCVFEYPPKWCT